jgi:hypothetical protein
MDSKQATQNYNILTSTTGLHCSNYWYQNKWFIKYQLVESEIKYLIIQWNYTKIRGSFAHTVQIYYHHNAHCTLLCIILSGILLSLLLCVIWLMCLRYKICYIRFVYKETIILPFSRRVIKLTAVIIEAYHCYQLHTKFYPISFP